MTPTRSPDSAMSVPEGVELLAEQPADPTAAHTNAATSRRARGLISVSTATP